MSFTIKIYEEYGEINSLTGRGTVKEVNNINFKNWDEYTKLYYDESAIIERKKSQFLTNSYNKYYFFEISGEYPDIKDLVINLEPEKTSGFDARTAVTATDCKLMYGMTNIYEPPGSGLDGSLRFLDTSKTAVIYPNIGNSILTATSRPILIPSSSTSLYTNYLKLQLLVNGSDNWKLVGNTPQYKIKIDFKTFKQGY